MENKALLLGALGHPVLFEHLETRDKYSGTFISILKILRTVFSNEDYRVSFLMETKAIVDRLVYLARGAVLGLTEEEKQNLFLTLDAAAGTGGTTATVVTTSFFGTGLRRCDSFETIARARTEAIEMIAFKRI